MQYSQETLLQSLQRMERTIQEHPELSAVVATTAHNRLVASIAELSTHASSQEVGSIGSKGETARARRLRSALRAIHLQPIVAAARLCAEHNPALASVQMPRARLRTQTLMSATVGIIEVAHANESQLIEAGLRPTFLADIDAAMARLSTSVDDRGHYTLRRAGATAGLALTTRRAREVIKIVNAEVQLLIGDNGPLLAEWKAAIRVAKKPGPASSSPAEAPSSTTPTKEGNPVAAPDSGAAA